MAGGILPDPASGSPLAGRVPGRVAMAAFPIETDPTRVPWVMSAERACAFAHVADIAAAIRTSKIRSLLRALSIGCRSSYNYAWVDHKRETPCKGGVTRQRPLWLPRGPTSMPFLSIGPLPADRQPSLWVVSGVYACLRGTQRI